MNKKTLLKFKNILLNTEKELLSTIKRDLEIDSSGDETDLIQAGLIASLQTQLSTRDREKLVLINAALKKIEDGSFGNCESCEEEILEKRLLFNPATKFCLECAEDIELENKRKSR